MIAPNTPCVEEIQQEFVGMLPELTSRFTMRFHRHRFEKRTEALAEAIGLAWETYLSARRRGKAVTTSTLAFYICKAVASGRKVAGVDTLDAMATETWIDSGFPRCVSMQQEGVSHVRFYQTFGDRSWRWPVLDYVAPLLDMESFLSGCGQRDQQIVVMKLQGHEQKQIAAQLGISPPAVTQRLNRLRRQWQAMATAS